METKTILQQFKEKVSDKIYLEQQGINRFNVITPFLFEDGDHLIILLKYDKNLKKWYLTDEAHTYMHLSYFFDEKDIFTGTRKEIIDSVKNMQDLIEKNGELIKEIVDDDFGNALYDFVQALIKISDVTYLDRETIKTTFFQDFKSSIEVIAKNRKLSIEFNVYAEFDKNKGYPVDCVLPTKVPVFVFAIHNSNKCKDATISIYEFEKRNITFHPVAIFENQENIGRKELAHFSAVCDKQIPNLQEIHEFEDYLKSYDLV